MIPTAIASVPATHIDLYQLTSLIPHWDMGMANKRVTMSFFSRRLPKNADGEPTRGYLLWVGLRRCLDWLAAARFDDQRIESLLDHEVLGPAMKRRPELVERLKRWRFKGVIEAPPEGTPIWAGRAVTEDTGELIDVDGVRPSAQCPYLVVRCDLLTAKLIETPLLSIINHMTMIASKAAQVVDAAGKRSVLEFGTRRTHPEAALDAAYAAWIAGCAGTSNVEAHHRFGVPMLGTMDHFAIQSWEREGTPRHESEKAYFSAYWRAYPRDAILLVDTYDTFGEQTGIRAAVAATRGYLTGVRLDSQVTRENVIRARNLLDELGAPQAKIVVSGGMDEHSIRALADAPVDAFGVGERIVTSPDSPVGVGAVGKLCEIDDRPSMKLSRGSGKATLPGLVQVFREPGGRDVVAPRGEMRRGEPLLEPVWVDDTPMPLPEPSEVRDFARKSVAELPEAARSPRFVQVPVSKQMERLITQIVRGG